MSPWLVSDAKIVLAGIMSRRIIRGSRGVIDKVMRIKWLIVLVLLNAAWDFIIAIGSV
jgi:hypothetical protein